MTTRTSARDERGQILILTALSMTVLLGIAALSIDASFMYDKRSQFYAAADAAAKVGAAEVLRNPAVTQADLQAFADIQVTKTGLTPAACGSTTAGTAAVCVNHPPNLMFGSPFANDFKYVEVVVSQVTPTFFGNLLGFTSLTPGARAVAGISASPNCLVTLQTGIVLSGALGSITAPACDVVDAGDYAVAGTVTARSIAAITCSSGCASVTSPAPFPLDPLATLRVPSAVECNNGVPGSNVSVAGPTPLTPGTYQDISFAGGTLILQSGMYCITGNITVASPATPVFWNSMGGVTIYLGPAASLNLNSTQVTLSFDAQTGGVYNGIVFYQDRSNVTPVVLSQDIGTMIVNGALYFPSASVDLKNVTFASSAACGIIVAGAVNMAQPNVTLENHCTSFGGSPILTVSTAE